MSSRLDLHLDLDDCSLEERILLYLGPGLAPSPFLASSTTSAGFILAGFQSTASGPGGTALIPGPAFYNALVGIGTGVSNSGGGGTVSLYIGSTVLRAALANPGANGGAGAGSDPGGAGTTSRFNGYGATFSSGYNTSLDVSTTYGMSSSTIGSVPVHTFDRGSVVQPPPEAEGKSVVIQGDPAAPPPISGIGIGIGSQGFKGNLWENLIRPPSGSSASGSGTPSSASGPHSP